MNSDRSLQDDFCYQIAGPHYWLNLLPSSFPIRAQRGKPGRQYGCCRGRGVREGGKEEGRGGEGGRSPCFILCNSNPSFIHHHPTHAAEMVEGAVTAPSIFPVQTQSDVMVLLKRRCLLIWEPIALNQRQAAFWNWIRGRFEFHFSALLDPVKKSWGNLWIVILKLPTPKLSQTAGC